MNTFSLISPSGLSFFQAQGGTPYTANSSGLFTGVSSLDLASFLSAGCLVVGYNNDQVIFGSGTQNFLPRRGNLWVTASVSEPSW